MRVHWNSSTPAWGGKWRRFEKRLTVPTRPRSSIDSGKLKQAKNVTVTCDWAAFDGGVPEDERNAGLADAPLPLREARSARRIAAPPPGGFWQKSAESIERKELTSWLRAKERKRVRKSVKRKNLSIVSSDTRPLT